MEWGKQEDAVRALILLGSRAGQQIEDFTLIVYPFINGQDGFSSNLTDNQWVKLGSALRRVHDIDVPLSIQNRVRREVYSPKWREAVRSLYVHIEAEPTGDEIASKLLKFMKENILAIRRLVDRAEQLGQKLQDQSHKFVLCHSDIHGGIAFKTDESLTGNSFP